jgi:Tol biopolymer transport system component/DNA-binding winged helix-turn-helix (wHTH) protein
MPAQREPGLLRFGIFEFHARQAELRRGGVRLKLQEQPLRVLGLLLEHPLEVITREAIYERLWGQNSPVDFEHGLNTSIAKLRRALRDSAESPRYIETIARRGYRFIAPVERVEPEQRPATAVENSSRSPNTAKFRAPDPPSQVGVRTGEVSSPTERIWHRRFSTAVWTISLIVLAGAGVLYSSRARMAPEVQMTAKAFTSYPGQPSEPAFSPDGKQLAFIWNGPNRDNFDVYVKSVDGAEPQRLTTNSAPDLDPAWSADGRYIAFRREADGHCGIFIIPAGGGPERKVTETVVPLASGVPVRDNKSGMSWSRDGDHLLLVDSGGTVGRSNAIVSVSTTTGEKRILTSPPPGLYDTFPVLSADDRSFAFSRGRVAMGPTSIYVQPLDSGMNALGQPHLVFDDKDYKRGLDWTPSGKALVFGTRGQCWVVPVVRGAPRLLTGLCESPTSVTVAARQGRLAYTREPKPDENIYLLPLPVPAGRGSPASLIVSSPEPDYSGEFSPDGKKIALISRRSGRLEIWVCAATGSDCSPLTSVLSPEIGSPKWSPDGRQIAFDLDQNGHYEIYAVSVEGGAPRRLTTEKSHQARPNWSADGHWVYFASDRQDGWQVWKMPLLGGAAVRVTRNGGFEAAESRDGRFVYYAKRPEAGIWRVPVAGGEESRIIDIGEEGQWTLVHDGIYVLTRKAPRGFILQFYAFATHRFSELVAIPANAINLAYNVQEPSLSISPDRRSILFAQMDHADTDIVIIEGFRD